MAAPSKKMQDLFEQWMTRLTRWCAKTGSLPRVALTQNRDCNAEERQVSGWLSRMQQLHRQEKLPAAWLERLLSVDGMQDRYRSWQYRLAICPDLRPPAEEDEDQSTVVNGQGAAPAPAELLSLSVSLASEVARVQEAVLKMMQAAADSAAHVAALSTVAAAAAAAKETSRKLDALASSPPPKRARTEGAQPPSWAIQQLVTNLQRLHFSPQARYNVAKDKNTSSLPLGCTFGLRWDYRGNMGIGKSTFRDERCTQCLKFICSFAKRFHPGIRFTSVQVNKSHRCTLHVDRNNVGRSVIITVGNHNGGELWVHRMGKLICHDTFVEFDGNEPHATYPFDGERFSIVFFVANGYERASSTDKATLLELGFPIPEPGLQRDEYARPSERLKVARKDLPPEISVVHCGSETNEDMSDDEPGSDDEVVSENNAGDDDDNALQDVEFKRALQKADDNNEDDDLDKVLRLSLEEYQEIQSEQADLETALRLSSLVARTSFQAPLGEPAIVILEDAMSAAASSDSLDVSQANSCDDQVLRQLCQISQCNMAQAKEALAKTNGDQDEALMLLVSDGA